jgi:alpha-beta hydrolase superfamily lysophospholipase
MCAAKSDKPKSFIARLQRRQFLWGSSAAAASAVATTNPQIAAAVPTGKLAVEEYFVNKGDVKLCVWRKRTVGDGSDSKPVLFLVHGSTPSAGGSMDLKVPGRTDYSLMEKMALYGFDVWTMDFEGYGRSTRSAKHCGIMTGVEDLKTVMPLVLKTSGQPTVMMMGESSGAIRAGVYAMEQSAVVDRLILSAFTYTGKNAPEIDRRRKDAEKYRSNPLRPISLATFEGIFNRDMAGTSEAIVAQAMADYELKLGNTVPSGTYLDMATKLPMVDPKQVICPVCIIRPEHDGNATEAELLEFYGQLPNKDKQFFILSGLSHAATLGINRHRVWHVMREFLTYPPLRTA